MNGSMPKVRKLELNVNVNTAQQNPWYTLETVLLGKYIAPSFYIKKSDRTQKRLNNKTQKIELTRTNQIHTKLMARNNKNQS